MNVYQARIFAYRDIDRAAGQARTHYITDVPGQQAVYMVKLEQATAYIAAVALDAQAPVPPYIAAEASAMEQTPLQIAQKITSLAAIWNDQVGPAIEGARMAGKAAVKAAQTPEDVQTALNAARAALDAF